MADYRPFPRGPQRPHGPSHGRRPTLAPAPPPPPGARWAAAKALLEEDAGPGFVEARLEALADFERLPGPDRALARELTLGCTRWRGALDHLITRRTDGRPLPAAVQTLVRLGLYQLLWLDRIPSFAAVNETVALARPLGVGGLTGLINAILRAYDREREVTRRLLATWRKENLPLGWSHPAWLVDRGVARWGKEAVLKWLEWNNTPPAAFARVNALKTTADALLERWRAEGVAAEPVVRDWLPASSVFRVESATPWAALPSFLAGDFYLQDPSTLAAPLAAEARPGETILDLCAAPGGKTAVLAAEMRNQGTLVAHDLDAARLARLRDNVTRLGLSCVTLARSLVEPAAAGPFDAILIDAPCSNTGVLRRRAEVRWRLTEAELVRLADAQRRLLADAVARLKPGGRLVYSTCSLEPEENDAVADAFLSRHREFVCDLRRQLTPMADGVDGAFIARFRRRA